MNINIARINSKIHITLFIIMLFCVMISLGFSFFKYSKIKFEPDYKISIMKERKVEINESIHLAYKNEFIVKNTILTVLKNLFFITLFYNVICFSLVLKDVDLLGKNGKRLDFSQFISHGLYLVIAMTLLYMVSIELIIPKLEEKLFYLKNNTARAATSLYKGNEYFNNNDFKNALFYYYDYLSIIENDKVILDRKRELENKIKIAEYEEKDKNADTEDTSIAENQRDYLKLADIYYQKKDYKTAMYYYKIIAEGQSAQKSEAKQKIESIRKIFKYENSMKDLSDRIKDQELEAAMNKLERDIQSVYLLKAKAEKEFKNNEFAAAYFTYADILKINPNLREVVRAKNSAYSELRKTACELSDMEKAKIYPGKKDFVFFNSRGKLAHFGSITVGIDTYYLYNVKIYELDGNFNIISVVSAPFGETKGLDKITLYSFSKDDRKIFNFPQIVKNNKIEPYGEYIIKLAANMDILYNFSYDYAKTINFSLFKLFKLKKIVEDEKGKSFSVGFNVGYIKTAILEKISLVFLFFSVNLIFLGFAYRFRSRYTGRISFFQILLMSAIPMFLYLFVNIIKIFVSSFYSVFAQVVEFYPLLIACFVLNILVTFVSIIYIATTK